MVRERRFSRRVGRERSCSREHDVFIKHAEGGYGKEKREQ